MEKISLVNNFGFVDFGDNESLYLLDPIFIENNPMVKPMKNGDCAEIENHHEEEEKQERNNYANMLFRNLLSIKKQIDKVNDSGLTAFFTKKAKKQIYENANICGSPFYMSMTILIKQLTQII